MQAIRGSVPKAGNRPEENEDAWACAGDRGMFSVSDGASESIFSGLWARILVERAVSLSPQFVTVRSVLDAMVDRARDAWYSGINWEGLKWNVKNKATRGSHATLLIVHVGETVVSSAVGDSCLFIRKGQQLVSFPIRHVNEFGITPSLVWSGYGAPLRKRVSTRNPWKVFSYTGPYDEVLLATDALSAWVMSEGAGAMERLRSEEPETLLPSLQREGSVRNDDLTFILVRR
ncbi:hypothetical protein GCM10007108_12130 [Thermogymnomonas acidicola]|uniref:PPM-type phosphatase domain-containing protein n=1 Tax=Thermogymnomonas acidicola TaxID=399579 RepID=A0AA37F9T7_9ARCH|nr:protein phosphatase 2C domain-containing protein [Thermogymnomonas acidicola]GGM75775.1 hypothetical protein GCM10007108_12130 [Thermogymnomonas acidicola]